MKDETEKRACGVGIGMRGNEDEGRGQDRRIKTRIGRVGEEDGLELRLGWLGGFGEEDCNWLGGAKRTAELNKFHLKSKL